MRAEALDTTVDNSGMINKTPTNDRLVALTLFVLAVLYRIGDRATVVYDWDYTQYLLALFEFDVTAHQPHPPGNPLFIFAGWLLMQITGNGQVGLYIISVGMFGLGVVCIYYLGKMLFDDLTGVGASLFYIFTPLSGFFLAYPNTYVIECGVSSLVWLLAASWLTGPRTEDNKFSKAILILPWVIGFLSGFRMTFLVFSMPAFLYLLLIRQRKRAIFLLANLVVACLLWAVPLIIMSGGPVKYYLAYEAESAPFIRTLSVDNMLANLDMFWKTLTGASGYFAVFPLLYGAISGARILFFRNRFGSNLRATVIFSIIFVIPPAFFFIKNLMHPGYMFIFFPLLALGTVRSLIWIGRVLTGNRKPYADSLAGLLILVFMLMLMFRWTGRNGEFFSRTTIINSKDRVSSFVIEMQENFEPENSAIVSMEHFRQVQWYLPESYAIFPQASFVSVFGTDPQRANIYTAHMGQVHPRAWHLKRDGPVSPVILPEEVEYIIVSPDTFQRLGNTSGFNSGETGAGEVYFWKKVDKRIAITMDGEFWVLSDVHVED